MRQINLLIFLVILGIPVYTQMKPRALKFDEFVVADTSISFYQPISDRIGRFVRQAIRSGTAKQYVIYYRSRITEESTNWSVPSWAQRVKFELIDKGRRNPNKVEVIDGGYRDKNTLEFWIVPRTAPPPTPSPTYKPEEAVICPSLSIIDSDGMNFDVTRPVTFRAYTSTKSKVNFQWSISSGTIIGNDKGDFINVDPKGNKRIFVSVEASGFPTGCNRSSTAWFDLGPRPYLFDYDDNYQYSSLAARVDNFVTTALNNPELKGYIYAYAGRGKNDRVERDRALASLMRIFAFRRFSGDQVKLVNAGYREHNSVDMWFVPAGVDPPKPSPSVDPSFIKILKNRRIYFEN